MSEIEIYKNLDKAPEETNNPEFLKKYGEKKNFRKIARYSFTVPAPATR
jgi:hypothetical protein